VLKVRAYVWPAITNPESNDPLVSVTVCGRAPVFDHTSVVPVAIVLDDGVYPLSKIVTSPPGEGVDGSVVVGDWGTVVVGVEPPPPVTVIVPVMPPCCVQK